MSIARPELLQGTLELLILKILSVEPMHGWGITQRLELTSRRVLQVNQGSLYPALERLKRKGWIGSTWRTTENNRRARYYHLTADGKKQTFLGKLKGEKELTVDDAVLRLLALRQRQLLDALATRGHAAQQAIRLESPQEQAWKAGKLPKPLSAARAHPEWSSLNGKVRGEEDRQQLIDALAKRT